MDKCIMCPAYQKFYSSLISLDEFVKSKDFFVMVSSLDKFLSEFRNITFVLQKSIGGTEYTKKYEILREKYFSNDNSKWIIKKRNEVLKEKPFDLNKKIIVDVYLYGKSNNIIENSYTYENWDNAEQLTNQIKNELKKYKNPEIYLSTKIKFIESGKEVDIIELIKLEINSMCNFLSEFNAGINEECSHCKKIQDRIFKMITDITARKVMLEKDYEYIPKTNVLEPKSFSESMGVSGINVEMSNMLRAPLKGHQFFKNTESLEKMFETFISRHTIIYAMQEKRIMPTIFIFYNDDTFAIDSFLSESKSTMYRKINTVASNIDKDSIVAVFVVWESYVMSLNKTNMKERYDKRVENAEKTMLCFYSIDKSLNEKSVYIDSDLIVDNENLPKIIQNAISNISSKMKWGQYSSLRYGFATKYHKYLNLDKL